MLFYHSKYGKIKQSGVEIMKKSDSGNKLSIILVLCGVALNVCFGFATYKLKIPMYFDTIGTIGVAALCGILPGFIVAVLTNLLCSLVNSMAIYYTILNILIAGVTAFFVKKDYFKIKVKVFEYVLILAIIGGGIGSLFQLALLGHPQFQAIAETAEYFSYSTGLNYYCCFIILNILLNFIDKGISAVMIYIIIKVIPKEQKISIWNSGWMQRPLTTVEINNYRFVGKGVQTVQRRLTSLLITAAVLMTLIMGTINVQLYYKNQKLEYQANSLGAVKLAAAAIDPEMIDAYIKKGENVPGYIETYEHLYNIKYETPGIQYLYVIKIVEEGCRVVFDVETDDVEAYKNGDLIEFEKAFYPYISDLLEGKEIAPIESNDISGWVLTTYYPIKNQENVTVAYACADVSMLYLSDYIKEYILKAGLIFSGFFLLIIAYGLWVARFYLVYPINSMAGIAASFNFESEDNKQLRENVKKIEALDIHTNDELENLYHIICKMTEDTVEQINDIRIQAKRISQMQSGLIITMADMVESRDSNTGYHILKTADYVAIILEALKEKGCYADKLTPKYIEDVKMSAPLHDIGKINIPDAVLNKPGKLTDEEYEIMKRHTIEGKKLLEKAIDTVQGENYLKEARNMAAYHHEKWDGSGYPDGLKGSVIPLSARIMAVADVFDALTAKRVYKDPMPFEKAMSIIKEGAGTHFDPTIVEVFVESEKEVRRVLKKYQD